MSNHHYIAQRRATNRAKFALYIILGIFLFTLFSTAVDALNGVSNGLNSGKAEVNLVTAP